MAWRHLIFFLWRVAWGRCKCWWMSFCFLREFPGFFHYSKSLYVFSTCFSTLLGELMVLQRLWIVLAWKCSIGSLKGKNIDAIRATFFKWQRVFYQQSRRPAWGLIQACSFVLSFVFTPVPWQFWPPSLWFNLTSSFTCLAGCSVADLEDALRIGLHSAHNNLEKLIVEKCKTHGLTWSSAPSSALPVIEEVYPLMIELEEMPQWCGTR